MHPHSHAHTQSFKTISAAFMQTACARTLTVSLTHSRTVVQDHFGGNLADCARSHVHTQSFKTISAAILSHPGHVPVTLELQKCPQ